MTQDTEDVVNYLGRASASPEELKAAQIIQSLSDRIDELTQALEPFADKATFIEQARETWKPSLGPVADGYTVAISLGKLRKARAALHQEGIAP